MCEHVHVYIFKHLYALYNIFCKLRNCIGALLHALNKCRIVFLNIHEKILKIHVH